MLLRAQEVACVLGDRTILNGVDLTVGTGERLALIGENGSGKTTLLRILAGAWKPDKGQVTRTGRVALLQQQAEPSTVSVMEAVTPTALQEAKKAFEEAAAALDTPESCDLKAFNAAEEHYRWQGGYDFEARAEAVLTGLDLPAQARMDELSGGQLRRVLLAGLLLSPADVYLLDEPTNHLDAGGAHWLESWIASSPAAFVLASYDRAFLDAVATRTAEIERGTLTVYPGSYSPALELKATLREAQERDYAAYKRKRSALEEEQRRLANKSGVQENRKRAKDSDKFRSTFKAEANQKVFSARAKAMQKQIERLDAVAVTKPYQDHRVVRLDLPAAPLGPAEVLTVRDLTVQREQHTVLDRINLHLRRGTAWP